jgi:hypothetical protein
MSVESTAQRTRLRFQRASGTTERVFRQTGISDGTTRYCKGKSMPVSQPKVDPVSPFAQQVLAVYADALPKVRFPDLDLAALQATAEELRSAQVEVERIFERMETELEAARSIVRAQAELLNTRAERALAYARVFADGDAVLTERLAEMARVTRIGGRAKAPAPLPEGAPPRKRGRPRKSDHDASLFAAEDAVRASEDVVTDTVTETAAA